MKRRAITRRAKQMLDQLGVIRPSMQKALKDLEGIPVDIQPVFVTANEIAPDVSAQPASFEMSL